MILGILTALVLTALILYCLKIVNDLKSTELNYEYVKYTHIVL